MNLESFHDGAALDSIRNDGSLLFDHTCDTQDDSDIVTPGGDHQYTLDDGDYPWSQRMRKLLGSVLSEEDGREFV